MDFQAPKHFGKFKSHDSVGCEQNCLKHSLFNKSLLPLSRKQSTFQGFWAPTALHSAQGQGTTGCGYRLVHGPRPPSSTKVPVAFTNFSAGFLQIHLSLDRVTEQFVTNAAEEVKGWSSQYVPTHSMAAASQNIRGTPALKLWVANSG